MRTSQLDSTLTPEQRKRVAELEAVGYAAGSNPSGAGATGVVVHDFARAFQGLNFYVSGHAPEAILMDMAGRVLHRWSYAFGDVWPDHPIHPGVDKVDYWRRAYLFENGDVLAIFDGLGIIKLDKSSRLIWAEAGGQHHDLEVLPNGEIYVLTRAAHLVPRVDPKLPVLEDFVAVLDSNGKLVREISLLECLENSKFRNIWTGVRKRDGDLFHTNSLRVLSGELSGQLPEFRKGRVLTSMLWLNAIAVVDLEERKVVWAHRGTYRQQHDPRLLANGALLLFDNKGAGQASRVQEYDAATMELKWEYSGSEKSPFFSGTCGVAQRLPNGNTLITESDLGRALEVTPGREIVWEFLSPHRAGEDDSLVATLFDVVRLDPRFPIDWAEPSGAP
jgi:hypothetical protein